MVAAFKNVDEDLDKTSEDDLPSLSPGSPLPRAGYNLTSEQGWL